MTMIEKRPRGRPVGQIHWTKAPNGTTWRPSRQVLDFVEWWTDPDRDLSETLAEWSTQHKVHMSTIRSWWKDKRFVRLVEKRLDKINCGPERVQAVVNAVWLKAVNGDMKAATLYLQYVDRLTAKVQIQVDKRVEVDVRSMSKDQLQFELSKIQAALVERQAIPVKSEIVVTQTESGV